MAQFKFQDVIQGLEEIGFYDVALPFLLIFTITFAILQKIKIFGEHAKNFNAVIAVALAFLVVRTTAIVEVMNLFLPKISLISLIIVVVLLLFGILLGKEGGGLTQHLGGIGIILTFIGVAIAFFTSTGALGLSLPSWLNMGVTDRNFFLGLLLFFIFFLYATGSTGQNGSSISKFLSELSDQFGGGGKKGD